MGKKMTLLNTVNNALTPQVLQELSTELSLPYDKTVNASKSIVPSLLMVFTHRGPGVVNLLNRDIPPRDLLNELLGNELTQFSTKLQPFTDMGLYPIINMMEKLVPRLLPHLRESFIQKDQKKYEMRDLLQNETEQLAEAVPTDISNHFGYGTKDTKLGRVSKFSGSPVRELTDYPKQ